MGRLVGIPHFFTEAAWSEEKDDDAAVRRAKKLDNDGETQLAERVQAVKRLQGHLTGHFLRRTTDSFDYNAKPLLPLPPYKEVTCHHSPHTGHIKPHCGEKREWDRPCQWVRTLLM